MNLTGKFQSKDFIEAMQRIMEITKTVGVPCGIHVVNPSQDELKKRLSEGFRFIPYSIDSVFLNRYVANPLSMD